MEQLSLNLEAKHTELAIKDGAIDKLTADLEAKDEQCISVSVELVKTLQAKRNQYITTLNRLKSRLGGRKPVYRSDAELNETGLH